MSGSDPKPPSLDDVEAKLKAIRERRAPPKRRSGGGKFQGSELAWRLVIDLTAGIAVGLAIGWGLDGLFGTRPLFMVVFVLFGFAAGVRVMLQSAKDMQRRRKAAEAAEAEAAAIETAGAKAPRDDTAGAPAPDDKDEGR